MRKRWECTNCGKLLGMEDLREGQVEIKCYNCHVLNLKEAGESPQVWSEAFDKVRRGVLVSHQ